MLKGYTSCIKNDTLNKRIHVNLVHRRPTPFQLQHMLKFDSIHRLFKICNYYHMTIFRQLMLTWQLENLGKNPNKVTIFYYCFNLIAFFQFSCNFIYCHKLQISKTYVEEEFQINTQFLD